MTRVENAELGLRADLSPVPEKVTVTTKGFTDPVAHLQIGATVVLNDTSQVLEVGDRLNRWLIGEKMVGSRLHTGTRRKDCHAFGLLTADRQPKSTQ